MNKFEHKPFAEFHIISIGQIPRMEFVKDKRRNALSLQINIAKIFL